MAMRRSSGHGLRLSSNATPGWRCGSRSHHLIFRTMAFSMRPCHGSQSISTTSFGHDRLSRQHIDINALSSYHSLSSRRYASQAASHPNQDGKKIPSARPSGLRLLDKKRLQKQQDGTKPKVKKEKSLTLFGQDSSLPIRARFAPSPTGYMHLGSLRTAALNNMAALASTGGSFVLRVEDTDRSRFVEDAENRLIADLKWAGLKWDEGPDCGGPHGPYRQSERLGIYKDHAQKLLDQNHAYRCFCSQEQLDAQKTALHEAGQSTAYPKTCRSISAEESDRRAAAGEAHLLRFKGDAFGRPKFRDTIFGLFQKGEDEEDFVILKTDGYPTYHLANVIDDHLMKITHVIRGEEWLVSTPKHIALYSAFGWEPPTYSHLALLVNPDGSKLSKRQNSRGISDQREAGIAPMPLVTWLISLGGGTQQNKIMASHPRDIQGLSKAMQYNNLKRVPIRVTHEHLQAHQLAYARTLAEKHISSMPEGALEPQEVGILEDICRPLLRRALELQRSTEPSGIDWPHPLWNERKALLLPLQNVDADSKLGEAAASLYHLLSLRQITSLDSDELLAQYPYFVWQIPDQLYKDTLTRWTAESDAEFPVNTVIELENVLNDETCPPPKWMARLRREDKQEMASVYSILRLIATGVHDQPSPPASTLFLALSRADWLKRVHTVLAIMKELK